MSSLTGMATGQISDIFKTMIFNGQMKMVGATCAHSEFNNVNGFFTVSSPGNISIPALTGNQIAVVYLEVTLGIKTNTATPSNSVGARVEMSASGTGISINTGCSFPASASVPSRSSSETRNSSFGITSQGNQTISFTSSGSCDNLITAVATRQAVVFIYSPPF
jgi:hypothetical protein